MVIDVALDVGNIPNQVQSTATICHVCGCGQQLPGTQQVQPIQLTRGDMIPKMNYKMIAMQCSLGNGLVQ